MEADPELKAIMMETKMVQGDTLTSTQNSVRAIKETVLVADKTSATVTQQGEQLDRIEEKATKADANASDSYKNARSLHQYKGFFSVSMKNWFTGAKKRSEDDKLATKTRALDEETVRLGRRAGKELPGLQGIKEDGPSIRSSDDPIEQGIDANLDEISAGLDHIQMQASTMGAELDRQNVSIRRTEATTEHTKYMLNSADRKINEFV